MVTTPNKGYELQVTGTNTNTWGTVLNTDVFTRIDDNLGGVVTKSLTNVNVNLSAAESRMLRLVLNGTLTGNVLVQTEAIGMTIIENNCTGSFSVTFRKNGIGSAITIPNGTKVLATTGASGNPNLIGVDFPAGTRLPFQQTTPPAGWTKEAGAGFNDAAFKCTTGTVAPTGGTRPFSTAFTGTRTPSGAVGGTTLTESQIPAHGHPTRMATVGNNNGATGGLMVTTTGLSDQPANSGDVGSTIGFQIGGTGGSQSHTHSLTMNQMDFDVKYVEFTIGVKS